MNSAMFQNSSDPEAIYRNKAGKIYRGYAANIEEFVGAAGFVITDYQYDQNIHSDSQFPQERNAEAEISEEMVTLITDGGYGGGDNMELARKKNIDFVTTALIGKDAPDVLADFEFSEDGIKLEKCAVGYLPKNAII